MQCAAPECHLLQHLQSRATAIGDVCGPHQSGAGLPPGVTSARTRTDADLELLPRVDNKSACRRAHGGGDFVIKSGIYIQDANRSSAVSLRFFSPEDSRQPDFQYEWRTNSKRRT